MKHISKPPRFLARAVFAFLLVSGGLHVIPASAGETPLYNQGIADLANAERYPDECAVVLTDNRVHTWSFAKTVLERSRAVKILTREGIEQYGDFVSDIYRKGYFDYRLDAAVVSPGGERTTIGTDRVKTVEFGKTGLQYRMALPGLETGSIIEIRERVESKYAITAGRWNFSCRVPTLRSELVFRVPRGAVARFNFTPKKCLPVPSPEPDDRLDIYTITMEIVPPYLDEPYMPRCHAGNPTVFYHIWQVTMEDYLRYRRIQYDDRFIEWMQEHNIPWDLPLGTRNWIEIAGSFVRYYNPTTWEFDDRADEYRPVLNEMLAEMPETYTEDPVHDLDLILAEFHRRFQSIESEFFYINPERNLSLREGNPFELAYLLKWILNKRSIWSSVVIAGDASRGMLDRRNPDPYALRRPLLLIDVKDERYWIDPFDPVCRVNQLPWEYQGVNGLWLKENDTCSFVMTPLDAAPVNCASHREDIAIDSGGRLSARAQISLTGQCLLEARREHLSGAADWSGDELLALVSELLPAEAAPDSAAVESDTRDTLIVSCNYAIEKFCTAAGDFMNLDFSDWCTNPVFAAFESEHREQEIMFPFPATTRVAFKITIPPGRSIRHQPPDVNHEDTWFSYSRSCRLEGDVILFERTLAITSPKVDAVHYGAARKAVEEILKHDEEIIVLKHGS